MLYRFTELLLSIANLSHLYNQSMNAYQAHTMLVHLPTRMPVEIALIHLREHNDNLR